MPRGISGPFFVSDGGTEYFAILPPQSHLLRAYKLLLDAKSAALRNFPGPEGRARALAIDVVLKDVQLKIDAAAALTAAEAEKLIVARIKATQVRPDPPGNSGRVLRLQDAISCRPIKTSVSGGAVGIGDTSVLNKVADKNGTPFWKAQEFGSTHNVGRTLYGLFQPGDSRPGDAPSRTHPLFEVTGRGGKMVIQNPIPERAFLREGSLAAEVFRQKALGNAVQPAIVELQAIQSGAHPRLRAARRYVSRRP
jgi:hypothetical protein